MCPRYLLFAVSLLALLVACGGSAANDEVEAPVAGLVPTNTEAAPAARATPTNLPATVTAVLPHTPTPSPTATTTPTQEPTAAPSPIATETTAVATPLPAADAVDVPELVWLPFGYGSYGEPILTLNNGQFSYEPEPAPIEVFFAYSPVSGQIAYGSLFFYGAANDTDSVTDLWVYDYKTGTTTQWLEGNVGRAAWSPVAGEDGQPQLAVAIHNGQSFDLHLMSGPFESEVMAEDILPYFSWSPNGERMAYVVADGVMMKSAAVAGPRVEVAMAQGVYQNGGWVGDAPVWDMQRAYLIYADNPFTFVNLRLGETSESFTPVRLDGTPLEETRPTKILWSDELRQLIGQVEDFSQNVQIYLLSEDLSTVIDIYFLENSQLVGWYEVGRSIIVLDVNQEPQIWSLVDYEYINP